MNGGSALRRFGALVGFVAPPIASKQQPGGKYQRGQQNQAAYEDPEHAPGQRIMMFHVYFSLRRFKSYGTIVVNCPGTDI